MDKKEVLKEIQPTEVDESIGMLVEDHIQIWDPETGEVQYEGRG